MSQIYQRRDLVADGLRAIGLNVEPPRATPYFWARVPEAHTSASFAELVLDRANVVISPGGAYGPSGEGFVRLSLTVADDRLEEAVPNRFIAGHNSVVTRQLRSRSGRGA